MTNCADAISVLSDEHPGGAHLSVLLLYAAFLLIKESRFALAAVNEEMDFMWKLRKAYGPEDLVAKGMEKTRWFGGSASDKHLSCALR